MCWSGYTISPRSPQVEIYDLKREYKSPQAGTYDLWRDYCITLVVMKETEIILGKLRRHTVMRSARHFSIFFMLPAFSLLLLMESEINRLD